VEDENDVSNQSPDSVPPLSTRAYSSIERFFTYILQVIRRAYNLVRHPWAESSRDWRGYKKLQFDSTLSLNKEKREKAKDLYDRYNDYKAHTYAVTAARGMDGGYEYHRQKWFSAHGLRSVDPTKITPLTDDGASDLNDTFVKYFPGTSDTDRTGIITGIKAVGGTTIPQRYAEVTNEIGTYSESESRPSNVSYNASLSGVHGETPAKSKTEGVNKPVDVKTYRPFFHPE